jgi:O-acetyl-ADP-ribose deacetylase (regulator of RNase III)
MIQYTQGNLLEADVEALVNTVNTVGVMGKGIALMFKDRFPLNMKLYAAACKAKQVQTGKVFVTEVAELTGPRWIINFPTKQHWRAKSKMDWLITKENCEPKTESLMEGMKCWTGGATAAQRKVRLFDSRSISIARLNQVE